MPKVAQPENGRGEAIMPASLTQNPPFHCAKLHVQRGPCSRYVGTHVSALSSLRKRRGARILSPNSERSPTPHPASGHFGFTTRDSAGSRCPRAQVCSGWGSGGEGEERQGGRRGCRLSGAPRANEWRGREPPVTGQSGKRGRDETCGSTELMELLSASYFLANEAPSAGRRGRDRKAL